MSEQDVQQTGITDEEFERGRLNALRCFAVTLADGDVERVWGHHHENTNHAGHLNVVTVQKDGRQVISDSFAFGTWTRLKEVNAMVTPNAQTH